MIKTYNTNKTASMPLSIQRLHNHIRHRLAAALALGTEAMRMAVYTPRIPLLLHKGRRRVKRVAALRAEKVTGMPFCAARDDDFALDGRLARLAAWREELVEVEVAEESLAFICAVLGFEARHVVGGGVGGQHGDVVAREAGADALDALGEFVCWLGVEGDALEMFSALVAGEAFWVETNTACGDDTASDWESTLTAKSACTDSCRGPVSTRCSSSIVAVSLSIMIPRVWQWACGRSWSKPGRSADIDRRYRRS